MHLRDKCGRNEYRHCYELLFFVWGGGGVCGEGSSLGDTPFHVCFKMWRIALNSCSWECMVQMMIKSRWICEKFGADSLIAAMMEFSGVH